MSEAKTTATPSIEAKLVTGSTMRHVVVMTLTSSIGLTALFLVDFADLYFLSLLGESEVAGAIGFAGAVIYFNISICVGLTIAVSALVARAVGGGRDEEARRLAASTVLFALLLTLAIALLLWLTIDEFLQFLGAQGAALEFAESYARITILSLPLLGLGMCCNGILRALGDAKRAMYTTLAGGLVNAILDPIFIFSLDMGVDGAAWASVCARFAVLGVGLYGTVYIHRFLTWPSFAGLRRDVASITKIAAPVMLTNVATPFGVAYVTATLAQFGDDAVAASAVINRIVPLAFGVIFSLSGAIGPIIGQNYGALRFDRMRQSYLDALKFALIYVTVVCVLLFVLRDAIAALFNASPGAAALIGLFCTFVAFTWAFAGAQYVANASFNNLGKPHWSTLFNWGKATIGTIPFVHFGALWAGAEGALLGMGVGSVVFGIAAGFTGYSLLNRMATPAVPSAA
jgi:putative MATE family efflux protein